jgi:hypothetical protein
MTRKRATRLALTGGLATLGTVATIGLTQAHASSVQPGAPSVAPTGPVATTPVGAKVANRPITTTRPVATTPIRAKRANRPTTTTRPTAASGAWEDSKGMWHVPGAITTDDAAMATVAPTPETGSH